MSSRNDRLLPWKLDNPNLVEEKDFLQSVVDTSPGAIVSLPKRAHAEINVNGATAAILVSVEARSPFAALAHVMNSNEPTRFSKMTPKWQKTCIAMDIEGFNVESVESFTAPAELSASVSIESATTILKALGRTKSLNVFIVACADDDAPEVQFVMPPFDPKRLNAAILCLDTDGSITYFGMTDESSTVDEAYTLLTSNPIIQVRLALALFLPCFPLHILTFLHYCSLVFSDCASFRGPRTQRSERWARITSFYVR